MDIKPKEEDMGREFSPFFQFNNIYMDTNNQAMPDLGFSFSSLDSEQQSVGGGSFDYNYDPVSAASYAPVEDTPVYTQAPAECNDPIRYAS